MKNFYKIFFIAICCFLFINLDLNAQDTISSPNPDGYTKIYVGLYVNNISEINAATQIIKTDIVITVSWIDPRLKNDSKGYIISGLDKIWDPNITFINRLGLSKSFPEHVAIFNDGSVYYVQRLYGEFSQNLIFNDFPFDKQTLLFTLIDMSLSGDSIMLEIDTTESGINRNISAPDWTIMDWDFRKSTYTMIDNTRQLSSLVFEIKAERQSGYYILIFVIPLLLIIMMSWMAFWLDPSLSSSQISIATTSMLTLIAYRFIVTSNLPKIAYLTKLDMFILGSSILIFITLLESIVTSTISSKGNLAFAHKIDLNCRWIFPVLYFLLAVISFYY